MITYREQQFAGERALYAACDAQITDCIFDNGESPLKEARNIELSGSMFRWKYPLWYCKDVLAKDCTWFEMARAGVWYTENITVENALIQAPKNFRRCRGVTLKNVTFSHAAETLWTCENVRMENVFAKGDYFAMNCENLEIDGLRLDGNYSFDGAKNVTIRNSQLLTKDAFWNSENVTVYDSFLSGEYLGWNSKNLTLIGCTIESLQGLCYIDRLKLIDCKLLNTTLAFEFASVDATISTAVESVLNPTSGTIRAPRIKQLIIEPDRVDPAKTHIVCDAVDERLDRPEWLSN